MKRKEREKKKIVNKTEKEVRRKERKRKQLKKTEWK